MTEIKLKKGEPVEKALRRLKKKIDREGTLKIVRSHRHYEKPSERRKDHKECGDTDIGIQDLKAGGKREQLELVLRGDIQDHHRYLLGELLADLEFVEGQIVRLDQELLRRMQPYQDNVERLCTIPGVDILTAWTVIAELGANVTAFPDAAHAASWAGLCPGNRESAGKRLSGRTKKGNRWLRRQTLLFHKVFLPLFARKQIVATRT